MTALSSRYRFTEDLLGVTVEGDERPPVRVGLRPTGLEAWHVEAAGEGIRERFGFFNFGRLLEFVARGVLRSWQPQEGWHGIREWAQQRTARALASRLREHWSRLLSKADPTVLAVQRAIFAATFGDAPLADEDGLYRDSYLVRDVMRFPAAAIAVRNAWLLSRDLSLNRLLHSPAAAELHRLAGNLHLRVSVSVQHLPEPDVATQFACLRNWKALFADTGEPYRSLNRTLMNLPGGLPHRQVCNLRLLHLERPVVSRLELLVLTFHAVLQAERGELAEDRADHTHTFMHATAEQVAEALKRVAAHTRQPLSVRKAADVKQLVQFLADYPDRHTGNLIGLTERAIRWHRHRQQQQMAAVRRHYGGEMLTALPPIPLPLEEGVRFLDTVGAVCAEAERMQHCVASYVDLAVQGNCYLFHVQHRSEEATVEVGCEGRVRQAQGPRNASNRAARWGKRLLNRWALSFPGVVRRPVPIVEEGDEEIPF